MAFSPWLSKLFAGEYDGTITPEKTEEQRKKEAEELKEKMRKPDNTPPIKIPGKKDAV